MQCTIKLLIALLFVPLTANAKCPVNFIEVHGTIVGQLSPDWKVAVALVFKKDRNHPQVQLARVQGASFGKSVEFFTLSREGYLWGLFGEWGERCNRSPEKVTIRLIGKDGGEIDKVTLSVRRDFDVDSKAGYVLRSPIILHSKS